MKIRELTDFLEELAPPAYQESYDNAGLIVGDSGALIRGVLICLDSTEAVVAEAIEKGCNLIIAHHPIIFRGVKRLTGQTYVERTVRLAIRHDIAIYAIHTNLDNVYYHGVNTRIADRLELTNRVLLAPREGTGQWVGSGMIGELEKHWEEKDFLRHLKTVMKTECIRHTRLLGRPVQRVAVCGGSGRFLLDHAINRHADLFVTADFKYHDFFDADNRIVVADIGHFESEQFTIDLLHEIISQKFRNFAVYCTSVNTNPVCYFF